MILLEDQNIKTFLQKDMFQISLKNTVPWTYVISDLKWLERFLKKKLKKLIKKSLDLKN